MSKPVVRWLGLVAIAIVAIWMVLSVKSSRTREPVETSKIDSLAASTMQTVAAGQGTQTVARPANFSSNSPSQTISSNAAVSPEFDLSINPYAGALREPGKSKRAWDENFLRELQNVQAGSPIQFELTKGRIAVGTVKTTQFANGELTYVSGELTEPEAGKFFFLKPPPGGRAGKAVGVVEFPVSQTAYRIEPTGPNGEPELWERRMDEVLCLNLPLLESAADTNHIEEIPPLRPDLVAGIVPAHNSNIVSLQSFPGSPAVLLLDFFGGHTPTWGGVTYPKPNVSNSQIKDVWKRVAEDFQPFNINVTTDIAVYDDAPNASRQRCVFTPSTSAVGSGAAGVAYIGSWNWGSDTVCWSVYVSGKSGAEVGAHEPGHTLGLGHQGTSTENYYGGHGSGATGWAPIMGVGYYQPVSSWARGEYQDADNPQNALTTIVSQNGVDYRTDDTGNTLATSRHLEIYSDETAFAEGVIERTGDTDAFQFTTTGGRVFLTAKPVGDWANLALIATLADASGVILTGDNPSDRLSATIDMTVGAGTYTFRVTGAGRNSPLTDGFSSYGSLGYFSVNGFVVGARQPTRLSVFEHAANGTVVGVIPANSSGSLSYAIVSGNSGNTFSINADGEVSVVNNTLLNYATLAANRMLPVQFELFVNIHNLDDANLTEVNRRVVISVRNRAVNQPVAVTGFNAGVIVPYDATVGNPQATGFDVANNFALYQAGLDGNSQVSIGGGAQGLPPDGMILSRADGTIFQLGPYGGLNALMLGYNRPRFGTLTLATPRAFDSLAVLASSANGGGLGTMVLNFADGTQSPVFNFNAQDWYGTVTSVAAQGFGRVRLGQATFNTENPGWSNPNLYQTTIDLASLGLNQPVTSISFTNPTGGGNLNSAVFAVSGREMPAEVALTQQPQSVTNNLPDQGATFSVVAMGEPPLNWQWFFSATGVGGSFSPLPDATNSTLTLPPVLQSTNAGSYFVVVTNSISAATSSVATLTLLREPIISQQPTQLNLALFAGRSAAWSVTAQGALPLNYSWRLNGAPVPGALGPGILLNNLQPANSGLYTVVVSNVFGSVTSTPVMLTVISSPTNFPYVQRVIADNPLAYWRLNELSGNVAHDYIGGRNGTYTGVSLGWAGYNPLDADRAARFGPANNSFVGNIPIDFVTSGNASFSIEAWVNGPVQTKDAGIVTKGTGAGGEQFNLDTGAGGARNFRFFVRDSGGSARLANGSIGPDGKWHHVVGVCNQAAGIVVLYVDGVSNASGTISPGSGLLSTTNAVTIGSRQSGTTAYDHQFTGLIDEVAIYNFALTPQQVQAHYAVRTNLAPTFTANPINKPAARAGEFYSQSLLLNAQDPNTDALAFSKISGPTWLNVAGNGAISGTPLAVHAGENSFLVRVSDPGGLFATATLNVTVIAPLTLQAQADGPNLVLIWTGGTSPYQVQMTTNLANPFWENIGGSISEPMLSLPMTNSEAFYRVLGQ